MAGTDCEMDTLILLDQRLRYADVFDEPLQFNVLAG
jgi:hypothetical protein